MTLEMPKRCLCLGLLVLVSFVMALPRAQEAPCLRTSSFVLSGPLPPIFSSLRPASAQKSAPEGLNTRLIKVRKFRRRRTTLGLTSHLQVSYHQAPFLNEAEHLAPAMPRLLSREPDSLVHPPA